MIARKKNRTMIIKKMKSESQDESDGENSAIIQK
jgi:hypothetical protein